MTVRETEVAAAVVEWLEKNHWAVFQEVQHGGQGGPIADIVAVQHPLTWIIECKVTLSMDLMAQASRWARDRDARFVSVAVPAPRRTSANPHGMPSNAQYFARGVLRERDIGVIEVRPPEPYVERVRVAQDAHYLRPWGGLKRTRKDILDSLHPEQRESVAGSVSGGVSTQWKRTVKSLVRHVGENPGCSMKQAIDGIAHHYGSDKGARATLATGIRNGWIPELRLDADVRPARLFLERAKDTIRKAGPRAE